MVQGTQAEAHDVRRPVGGDDAAPLERPDQGGGAAQPERDEAAAAFGVARADQFQRRGRKVDQGLRQFAVRRESLREVDVRPRIQRASSRTLPLTAGVPTTCAARRAQAGSLARISSARHGRTSL